MNRITCKKFKGGGNSLKFGVKSEERRVKRHSSFFNLQSSFSFLLAVVAITVTLTVNAENLYWKGGTGTEAEPADIYDPANWTTSSSYSGDSIAQSPTTSDILNFKFSALTYLTNSMENADSEKVCNQINFHGGECVILGDIKSAGTVRICQNSGERANVEVKGAFSVGGVITVGQNGDGMLKVEDGGSLSVLSTSDSYIGQNNNSKGGIVINGGNALFKGNINVGNSSTGELTINGGMVEVAAGKDVYVGFYSGKTGTVNLNGGVLKTKRITKKEGNGHLNFNGGTLQANAGDAFIIDDLSDMVQVQPGGGTIDANGYSVKIGKSITGEGAMTFKGGGTITFSYNCNHEGGTTIELGTKVSMSDKATTKILDNLVIDGRAVLEAKTYDVFLKSGLNEEATNNITLVNCAVGSTVGFDSKKISVNLAAPTDVNTTTPIMAFEGKTLNELKYADFTSRMFGQWANAYNALDSAKGCNKKFYYDNSGKLTSIVVEFQTSDGRNIRCVIVEFTDGEGGVYAKALGARYQPNASLGYTFLGQDKTTWNGTSKIVATSPTVADYGVCDFHWTPRAHGVTAWTLDADTTWSALRNGATLASDEIVQITVTDADAVLTVDEDVNVGLIEFVNGTDATLSIASGVTVSADNYNGLGYVLNNGTFQKWGNGTVELKFDNASRGVFVVNAGTLKAVGKRADGAGTPITGNPDETPRSNYLIDVKSGATYDVNGQTSVSASVRLAEGAHFISSTDYANKAWGQTGQLILAGNAEVTATGHFGLYKDGGSRLDLGTYMLTVNGASDKEFMLCGTTITGTGTIYVKSGRFCTRNADSEGQDCTISIGPDGKFENNKHFKVKNFLNNGSMSFQSSANGWGRGGVLEVTGEFTSKTASFPKLTLTGATVKAATGAVVTVLDTFNSSGTVTIDASEITKAALEEAMETGFGVPLLTVPVANKGGALTVANPPVSGAYVKWIDKGDSKSTLYLCKPKGTMIIIR